MKRKKTGNEVYDHKHKYTHTHRRNTLEVKESCDSLIEMLEKCRERTKKKKKNGGTNMRAYT